MVVTVSKNQSIDINIVDQIISDGYQKKNLFTTSFFDQVKKMSKTSWEILLIIPSILVFVHHQSTQSLVLAFKYKLISEDHPWIGYQRGQRFIIPLPLPQIKSNSF